MKNNLYEVTIIITRALFFVGLGAFIGLLVTRLAFGTWNPYSIINWSMLRW